MGEQTETVWLIDWENPRNNDFAIAEEVTVAGEHTKRPDIVLYVNGIALGVLELKRSTVSVTEGIRQNLDNQKKDFIQPFFATVQLVMAGNDTEGLRYGVIETPEKYYLTLEGGRGARRRRRQPARPRSWASSAARSACWRSSTTSSSSTRASRRSAATTSTSASRAAQERVRQPRGRHHLAHPGQRQEPDHGLAGQVDPRARAPTPAC